MSHSKPIIDQAPVYSELETFARSIQGRIIEDKFQVGKLFAMGTYGCVCQGEELKTETEIAIKIALKADPQLKHEIRILKKIANCLWIPTPLGNGKIGDKHRYLAMSIEGQSLIDLLESYTPASLIVSVVLNVLMEAVKALEFLHGRGVIHRDLHAANILLPITEGKGKIILIDYGLSAIRKPNGSLSCVKDVSKLSFVSHTTYDVMQGSPHTEIDDLVQLVYLSLKVRLASVIEEKTLEDFHKYKKYLQDNPKEAIPWEHGFLVPFATAVFKQKRSGKEKKKDLPKYEEIKEALKKSRGYHEYIGIY